MGLLNRQLKQYLNLRIPRKFSSGSTNTGNSNSNFTLTNAAIGSLVAGAVYHFFYRDIRSSDAYHRLVSDILLPLLRNDSITDAESAHNAAVFASHIGLAPIDPDIHTEERLKYLKSRVFGLNFRSPVCLAAGFDKQAEAMPGLLGNGFGAVEIGTVVPKPQFGNAKPRMFRLPEDGAVINRFGFNSDGLDKVESRLVQYWAQLINNNVYPGSATDENGKDRGLVGVNIGKNKDQVDAAADYSVCVVRLAPFADYITVNISSPNTPGLRALQGKEQLRALLRSVRDARDGLPWGIGLVKITPGDMACLMSAKALMARKTPPPILVKIAPDLSPQDEADIAAVVMEDYQGNSSFAKNNKARLVDGIIVSNTTISRSKDLKTNSLISSETGGLSGRPLLEPSTNLLRRMYTLTSGTVPLIGVGGVSSPEDAYLKIRSGASLVQVYTALAYKGPGLVRELNDGIVTLLKKDGFNNIADAVGKDVVIHVKE
jgi:dihydroorotate dehydrogenase